MKYYSRIAFLLSVPIVFTAIVLASLSVAHERTTIEPNWQVGDRWFVATELKRQEMIWKVADPYAKPQDDRNNPQGNNSALKDNSRALTAANPRPMVFQYDVLAIKAREHGKFHSAFLRITKATPATLLELGLPNDAFSNSEVELPVSMVVLEVRINNKEGGGGTYRGVSKFYVKGGGSEEEERSEKVWLDGRAPITTNFAMMPHDIPILTYPGRVYYYKELVVGEKDIFKQEENGFFKLKVGEREFPGEEKFVVKQTKNLVANSPVKVFWSPEQPWWSYSEDEKMKSWLLAVQRGERQIRSGDLPGVDLEEEIPDAPGGLMETKALQLLPGIVYEETTGRWKPDGKIHATSTRPWAGFWWPYKFDRSVKDGIALRWQEVYYDKPSSTETLSPAEKYQLMLSGSPEGELTNFEKKEHGSRQSGVAKWYGHCNAWAGASILDPQPLKPVTVTGKNGEEIRFEIGDLMALSTESHMELLSSAAGVRNNGRNYSYESEGIDYKTARDDINPSAFHLILANLIGVLKRSFVVDKDFGPEVWNHPVHQYKVEKVAANFPLEKKTRDRETLSDHRALLKKYAETPLIPIYVKTTVWIISDAITPPYEATPDEKLFTKNGEPVYLPRRPNPNTGDVGTTYEYILYVSADEETKGDIVDGIWFGSSRRNHPDFIWIPLANSREGWGYENPHLDEKEVRKLVLQSSAQ